MPLEYNKLKQGDRYRVVATIESAGGSQKMARRLEAIMQQWSLASVDQILREEIAPRAQDGSNGLQNPYCWPVRLADDLLSLSCRSKGRHAVAMQYLVEAGQARLARKSGPWQVTGADARDAVRRMMIGVAGLALEEQEATETFAGGLGEALEEAGGDEGIVEAGAAYEQGGSFTITMR